MAASALNYVALWSISPAVRNICCFILQWRLVCSSALCLASWAIPPGPWCFHRLIVHYFSDSPSRANKGQAGWFIRADTLAVARPIRTTWLNVADSNTKQQYEQHGKESIVREHNTRIFCFILCEKLWSLKCRRFMAVLVMVMVLMWWYRCWPTIAHLLANFLFLVANAALIPRWPNRLLREWCQTLVDAEAHELVLSGKESLLFKYDKGHYAFGAKSLVTAKTVVVHKVQSWLSC